MIIQEKIKREIVQVFKDEFNYKCYINDINIDQTPKNFDGLYTLILFPHLKHLRQNINIIGKKIGDALSNKSKIISDYNQVKGFLNFEIKSKFLLDAFKSYLNRDNVENVNKQTKSEDKEKIDLKKKDELDKKSADSDNKEIKEETKEVKPKSK